MSMTDTFLLGPLKRGKRRESLEVTKTSWGYSIRCGTLPPLDVLAVQLIAFFLGVCFVTTGLGLLLMPGLVLVHDLDAMRFGAAGLFVAGAAYLLWFASRGSQVEVQVNNDAREIMEVIQNRAGRPTILARYRFEDIGGVYLENGSGGEPLQLSLRHRTRMLIIAEGNAEELGPLRTKLARDLVGVVDFL